MKHVRLTILALSFALSGFVHAATVGGVLVPERVELARDGQVLLLNGAGLRKKFFFDIYVAALYLPEPESNPVKLLASPPRNRLLMHFTYNKVEKRKMDDTWREGFARSVAPTRLVSMTDRLERFIAMFGDMREGDQVWLDYEPGHGTLVSINGKPQGTVEGADFNTALLGIWLGRQPISEALKNALVGVDK